MALETVNITDFSGVAQPITVDDVGAEGKVQVTKIGFAADGISPTLVSAVNPLPVTGITLGSVSLTTSSAVIGKLALNSGVDIGDVDVTSIIPGFGATNLGKRVGDATGGSDIGVLALAIRTDSVASDIAQANGSNTGLRVNQKGQLHVTSTASVQYNIDVAAGGADTGNVGLLKRVTTLATVTPANGDWMPMLGDDTGAMYVNVVNGITGVIDDAAVTPGTTQVLMLGAMTDDTATDLDNEGDGGMVRMTLSRKLLFQPFESEVNHWSYVPAAGGLVNTTEVTAKAAAGSGLRNYITDAQVTNSHPTIGSEVQILDGTGGTVIHRGWASALGGFVAQFLTPKKTTANTLVSIKEATATATTGIYVNLGGYVGA